MNNQEIMQLVCEDTIKLIKKYDYRIREEDLDLKTGYICAGIIATVIHMFDKNEPQANVDVVLDMAKVMSNEFFNDARNY